MNPFQQAFSEIRKQQQLLAILIFGLVAVIVWIAVTLLTSQRRSALSAELKRLAEPLTPSINQDVLQRIANQTVYDETELAEFPIYRLVQSQASGREVITALGEEPPVESQEEIEAAGDENSTSMVEATPGADVETSAQEEPAVSLEATQSASDDRSGTSSADLE